MAKLYIEIVFVIIIAVKAEMYIENSTYYKNNTSLNHQKTRRLFKSHNSTDLNRTPVEKNFRVVSKYNTGVDIDLSSDLTMVHENSYSHFIVNSWAETFTMNCSANEPVIWDIETISVQYNLSQ